MDKKTNNQEKIFFESSLMESLSVITKTVSFLYKEINEDFFKQINLKNEELRMKNEEMLKLKQEKVELNDKNQKLSNKNDKLRFILGFSWMFFFILFYGILKYAKL